MGAGGAVFVQQGGSLTILAGSLSGGSVSGGAGSNGGTAGSAFGSGIFIQGSDHLTFAPASGQTLTIADVIADQSGSGGTGAGSVILTGAGTVVLSATNKYSGGTTLRGGTLSLQAPGAAGAGRIDFAYGTADTLVVGAGDVPSNIIVGFLPGDTIDLQGIGTATSATPGARDVLTISGGTTTVHLALNPAQVLTGETFVVTSDGHGGTLLTAKDTANDMPPSVTVAGTVAGNDHTALDPLASVTVVDLNAGQTESATLTLSSTLNGTLSNLAGGTYNATTGVYTVSGSTTAVTAALRGLVFTPTIHEVAPGQIVSTVFNLSVTDGLMTSTPATTSVNITALNDPPVISGMPPSYIEGYWNVPLNPFPAVQITDPDFGATETVTLSCGGTLSLSMPGVSLTQTGVGTYTFSAASPAVVSAALDALQYTTGPNPSVPGYTISYVGISVSDGIAPPVTAQVEVLTGLPIFTGTNATQTVLEGRSIHPFTTVAVTDSAGLSIQGMTITLYDSSSGFATPTDANGTLSGANLTKVGVGTYTLTPGSTAAVSAELNALTFTASANAAPLTTDFVLSAFDGATTADNSAIAVTATPVFTLTTGVDTIVGTAVNDTIFAAANTLSSGDSINGAGGANGLILTGGGNFDLSAPTTLINIQGIRAQEGAGAAAQTVTLRAGLNANVAVTSVAGGSITIIGAANSDSIYLGNGTDSVTLGVGEHVQGGSGNDTFIVTAATSTSSIKGGTGVNTLVVQGGGVVTMGGAVTGMGTVSLASPTTFQANTSANLQIAGSAAGGDVITLGAASQSVVSGGANELVKASAANAGAVVSGVGAGSTLEIISGGSVTENAATSVSTVKLDAATTLNLNGMAFIHAIGSGASDTITAGGINQTLTGGGGADTLIGYSGGSDVFLDTASGLNGDTIENFLSNDKIDMTDLVVGAATLTATASGSNTLVTVTSGATKSVFTMTGSFSASGFALVTDGHTGTFMTHS